LKNKNGTPLKTNDLILVNQDQVLSGQEEAGNTTTARDTSAMAGQSSALNSNYSQPNTNKDINSNKNRSVELSVLKEGVMPQTSSASKRIMTNHNKLLHSEQKLTNMS
jgi:hypothetical protein